MISYRICYCLQTNIFNLLELADNHNYWRDMVSSPRQYCYYTRFPNIAVREESRDFRYYLELLF